MGGRPRCFVQAPLLAARRPRSSGAAATASHDDAAAACTTSRDAAVNGGAAPSAPSGSSRRALLAGVLGGAVLLAGQQQGPAQAAGPFLESLGDRGILAAEEEKLYKLRQEREGEARKALNEERAKLERESRETMEGKLCATPFGVDVVGITELIALVGAVVGGVAARQRKDELERLNEQLRKINLSLRQQARAGTLYAPGLTYAPPIMTPQSEVARPTAVTTATATAAPMAASAPAAVKEAVVKPMGPSDYSTMSLEEDEMSTEQLQCRDALRAGKRLLKEDGAAAMIRFEKALMLSKQLQDKVQERRAMRGLAASARIQGQYKAAIKHLERVLEISQEFKEFTGDADAYGTIADCYTDLGDFDKAAAYYDKYIQKMSDGPV